MSFWYQLPFCESLTHHPAKGWTCDAKEVQRETCVNQDIIDKVLHNGRYFLSYAQDDFHSYKSSKTFIKPNQVMMIIGVYLVTANVRRLRYPFLGINERFFFRYPSSAKSSKADRVVRRSSFDSWCG